MTNEAAPKMDSWEDQISLNPGSDKVPDRIGAAREYANQPVAPRFRNLDFSGALEADHYSLPSTTAREGYYGQQHFNYWLSGLKDSSDLLNLAADFGRVSPECYFDFGGASGRVARHMAIAHTVPNVMVADINREHTNFVTEVFEGRIKAFQSSSVPHLPLEDQSLDLVSAYSVFSHIESFDETWLLELRRILRPGGILAITANIDNFQRVDETWPVFTGISRHPGFDTALLGKPLQQDRLIVRWRQDRSYSSVVFLSKAYVERRWFGFFQEAKIIHSMLPYQTFVVLKK